MGGQHGSRLWREIARQVAVSIGNAARPDRSRLGKRWIWCSSGDTRADEGKG